MNEEKSKGVRIEQTTFKHIRDFENGGGITIAYRLIQKENCNGNLLAFGVSLCSPKEKFFNKEKGRMIAERRLFKFLEVEENAIAKRIECKNYYGGIWTLLNLTHPEIRIMLINRFYDLDNMPSWFNDFKEKALRPWIVNQSNKI